MITLLILLVVLIIISSFFSASETGMMALNRYRLHHDMNKGSVSARRVVKLLARPDRLLGIILVGNTFANLLASAVATMIAVHYFGELGVVLSTLALTFVILVFSETAPKTYAAFQPRRVAYAVARILAGLLRIFYPLIWVVNLLANGLLRLFGVNHRQLTAEGVSVDELRSVVAQAKNKLASGNHEMLLRILDLQKVMVTDVMVPRGEIKAINIEQPWEQTVKQIRDFRSAYLPVYRDDVDQVIGVIHRPTFLNRLLTQALQPQQFIDLLESPYFIPEMVTLNQQLLNFRADSRTMALVVDEYGDIQGLLTVKDIVEEVVGEFADDEAAMGEFIQREKSGAVLVAGSINIRDLNRLMGWHLPSFGPNTLSGLVVEYLEIIPRPGLGLRLYGYPMEVIAVEDNTVTQLRVWEVLYQKPVTDPLLQHS